MERSMSMSLGSIDIVARSDGEKHPMMLKFYRRGQLQLIDNVMDIFEAG
jgi:hypothetical protein